MAALHRFYCNNVTIVGILTFMGMINVMLSLVEYEKSFMTSEPGHNSKDMFLVMWPIYVVISRFPRMGII